MATSWRVSAPASLGAVIGTLGGRQFRGALAKAFGNDHPAAFIEDAVAIGGAVLALAVFL